VVYYGVHRTKQALSARTWWHPGRSERRCKNVGSRFKEKIRQEKEEVALSFFDYLAELNRRKKQLDQQSQTIAANALLNPDVPTQAQAAYLAGAFTPGTGVVDASGQLAPFPSSDVSLQQFPTYMANTEPMPSMAENIQSGNVLDAFLQGVGVAGDAVTAVPLLGALGAPARAISRVGQAIRKGNKPEDPGRLEFTGTSEPPARDPGTSRTIQTTGKYRGAPSGVNSPQKLGHMQTRLRNYLELGAPYREWYEKTNDWVQQSLDNRPGRVDQYGGTVAITSSGTAVPQNAGFAIKGYNQAIVGDPIQTGRFPASMGKSIESVFSGTSPPLGPKREPFFEAIVQDPDRLRQTNDIRQARAFGYKEPDGGTWKSGLGEAQHRFMDEETEKLLQYAVENRVGGTDDWNKDRIQAAIWIAQKAEEDGSTIEEAARMFQDFTPQAVIRTEAAPSASSQHLGGLLDPDNRELLEAYSAAQDAAMQTPSLLDYTASQSGAMTAPTFSGPGVYEGASNPAYAVPVSIGKVSEAAGDVIDPASAKLVEANAAMQGLLRAQDTVGYTAILPAKRVVDRNALQVDLGRPITRDEIIELERKLSDEFGSDTLIPLPGRNGIDIIVPDPDVAARLNNVKKGQTPAWQKTLTTLVKDDFSDAEMTWGLNSGGLVGDTTDWTYTPSQYLPALEAVGPEMRGLLDRGAARSAPQLEKIDAALVKAFPKAGERQLVVARTRQALATGGIAKVRQLVEQGVLPAAVLGALLADEFQRPNQDQTSRGLL